MEAFLNWTYMPLIPPLLTLLLVLITKRVDLSLGIGILTSAFVITNGDILGTLKKIWDAFIGLMIEGNWLNTWSAYILIFLALLGVMSAFMSMSGGARAFTNWALTKITTRRGATFLTGVLGVVVFIDDYFSAIITGQVAKPLTDKYRVSRAKLAYFVDTTASPVSVIFPISSWGATIMGLTAPLLIAAGINHITPFESFIYMIPLNFYSIAALTLMFIVIFTNFDIFGMRREETRAFKTGVLRDEGMDLTEDEDLPTAKYSQKEALIVPLIGLAVGVLVGMTITGIQAGGSLNPLTIIENNSITHSLILGGIIGVLLSIYYYYKYTKDDKSFTGKSTLLGFKEGFLAMLGPMTVLTLAWMTGELIGELGTGTLLGEMVQNSNIPSQLIPAIVFIVACIMAVSTGTSWGSFGILVPIAGNIVVTLQEPTLLLPSIAAVLAGGVFGDHVSPISDSTILSSTGSGSDHITHVMTQIPYALIAATISLLSFITVGYTESTWMALIVFVVLFIVLFVLIKTLYKPVVTTEDKKEIIGA